MPGNVDDAIYFLQDGEFEKAKSIFSMLLDESPLDQNWITGYFISSYWDNKLDHLLSLKEGKERGKSILTYLEQFEKEISQRKIPRNRIYQATVHCVLEESIHHLRISFRAEGWNGLDPSTMKGLAISHLRLGEFLLALEILEHNARTSASFSDLGFLIAECYLGTGRVDEGKELYLRSFLDNPSRFQKECNFWKDLKIVWEDVEKSTLDPEIKELAIPVLGLQRGIFQNSRIKKQEDLEKWLEEIQRINSIHGSISGKFQKKTAWRTLALALSILDHFSEKNYPKEIGKTKKFFEEAKSVLNGELLQ
jgi:tetratricopeptide (TPR) repeat protein